jgi:hypothetical protein
MNGAIVIGAWRSMIGVDNRVKSTDAHRLEAAQDFLGELSGMRDQDQLRGRLVQEGARERNDDLSLLLLVEGVRIAADAQSLKEALNLLDWLLFVCPYGTEPHTFEAHGKTLQGILYCFDEQPSKARQVLEEARQLLGDLPGNFRGPA